MSRKILSQEAWEAQNPADFKPHGDRLLVEKIEIEDAVFVTGPDGQPTKIRIARANAKANNPRNPTPEYSEEQLQELARGWILVQVISVGNGHRLEIDITVPMPFRPGQYLYVERLAQHHQELQGNKYYIISQMDVLGEPTGLNLPKLQAVK